VFPPRCYWPFAADGLPRWIRLELSNPTALDRIQITWGGNFHRLRFHENAQNIQGKVKTIHICMEATNGGRHVELYEVRVRHTGKKG